METPYSFAPSMPLVSVIVVTYNSAMTVVETLDSIKNQTYQNLELIIADDCSIDNTLQVCREWLGLNDKRFLQSTIVTAKKNTGVPGNLNRGIKHAHGEWIKSIAGDDLLMNECVSQCLKYVMENKNVSILFSRMRYMGNIESINRIKNRFNYGFFYLTPRQQFLRLLRMNTLPAPTNFISKLTIESLGYYDETIPLMEDWPFWLKALSNHFKLAFMDVETVLYRVGDSLTTSHTLSPAYVKTRMMMEERLDDYRNKENFIYRHYIKLWKKYKQEPSFFHTFAVLFNPYTWYYKYIFLKEKFLI